MSATKKRGFASMSAALQREIASKGGRAAHKNGKAHEFSSEEAREAGRKGGKIAHARGTAHRFSSEEAREAGRKGGRRPRVQDVTYDPVFGVAQHADATRPSPGDAVGNLLASTPRVPDNTAGSADEGMEGQPQSSLHAGTPSNLESAAPMPSYPTSDESFARLRQAGWSVGEIRACSGGWLVTGNNGENVIRAEGQSQDEAWHRATLQAESAGMLRS